MEKEILQRLEAIEQRNKKVELDKARETSRQRKIIISILTYIVIVIFFYFAWLTKHIINAIVTNIWFLLTTISLPFFKKLWSKKISN